MDLGFRSDPNVAPGPERPIQSADRSPATWVAPNTNSEMTAAGPNEATFRRDESAKTKTHPETLHSAAGLAASGRVRNWELASEK